MVSMRKRAVGALQTLRTKRSVEISRLVFDPILGLVGATYNAGAGGLRMEGQLAITRE